MSGAVEISTKDTGAFCFFSSEHAAMKKIQDNLMFGGF
jgi:hypothetical protein